MVKKRKLTRDKVISVVNGKSLVGVYWEVTDVGSPTTRIKLWKSLSKKSLRNPFSVKLWKSLSKEERKRRKKMEADGSEILFECSPEKADRIIEIFNGEDHEAQALEKLEQRRERKKQEEDESDETAGKREWKNQ